jgi:hypothetical protein
MTTETRHAAHGTVTRTESRHYRDWIVRCARRLDDSGSSQVDEVGMPRQQLDCGNADADRLSFCCPDLSGTRTVRPLAGIAGHALR